MKIREDDIELRANSVFVVNSLKKHVSDPVSQMETYS